MVCVGNFFLLLLLSTLPPYHPFLSLSLDLFCGDQLIFASFASLLDIDVFAEVLSK